MTAMITIPDRVVTDNDITNTVTETDLYNFLVPGGTLGSMGAIRVTLYGLYSANSGTPSITIKVYYGTTVMFQDASFTMAAVTPNGAWKFELVLSAHNSVNAQEFTGVLSFGNRAAATTGNGDIGSTTPGPTHPIEGTAAENSASALNFRISITWSAANSSYHFNRKVAITEVVM
mgnify:CR=1 FL=1